MSTPPPVQNPASPPAGKEKEKAAVTVELDTKAAKEWSWYVFNTAWGLIPLAFALLFSGGAAMLNYQRNQSAALAILAFFFATIYYPYYALTSGGTPSAPVVSPTSSLMTAGRRLFKAMKKH